MRFRRTSTGLCLVVLVTLLSGCVQVPIIGQANFGEDKRRVFSGQTIGQDFYSSDRNLSTVKVFIYPSVGLKGKRSLVERRAVLKRLTGKNLIFSLYSLPDDKLVATVKQRVRKIRTAAMYSFPFKSIPTSKDKRYYWKIKAPSLPRSLAVSVGVTNIDRYEQGSVRVNDRKMRFSDAKFLPFIDMGGRMLVNSIVSRLISDLAFIIFWVLLVLTTLVFLVLAWRKPPMVENGGAKE